MSVQILIRAIPAEEILRYDRIRYNTNNCWEQEGCERPKNYREVVDRCNTGNWIFKFHQGVIVFRLDREDLQWMSEAQRIGRMTREFSRLHKDELEETLKKYQDKFPPELCQGKWFIRTERVSLKNGQYGVGPYNSLEKVIKSLVSSNPSHECFKPEDEYLDLYFLPFLEMDWRKEFRVFVYQGEITAISIQALYDKNSWIVGMTDEEKVKIVEKIVNYYREVIYPRMKDLMESYTFDLVLLGEQLEPYFIEPNSFGADYAAGASLFGWRQDHESLTDPRTVELRYPVYPDQL